MSWDVWIAVPVTSMLCSLSSAAGAAVSACALAEMSAPTATPAALKGLRGVGMQAFVRSLKLAFSNANTNHYYLHCSSVSHPGRDKPGISTFKRLARSICRGRSARFNVRPCFAKAVRLGLLAQPGRNQCKPQKLEQPVGDQRHQRRRNRPGENRGHIIQRQVPTRWARRSRPPPPGPPAWRCRCSRWSPF